MIYGKARHPQSQGLIEQSNGTTQRMFASYVNQHQICKGSNGGIVSNILMNDNWANLLPLKMYNLNTQLCSSIKTTPYEVLFS